MAQNEAPGAQAGVAGLMEATDINDLTMRFVMDSQLFDSKLASKHLNDYYRYVMLQRLLEEQDGIAGSRGISVESEPPLQKFEPRTVLAFLTDLDPESERMGFLAKPYQQALKASRSSDSIRSLVQKALARMNNETIVARVSAFRTREAQRRLYLIKSFGVDLIDELNKLPTGIISNIGGD